MYGVSNYRKGMKMGKKAEKDNQVNWADPDRVKLNWLGQVELLGWQESANLFADRLTWSRQGDMNSALGGQTNPTGLRCPSPKNGNHDVTKAALSQKCRVGHDDGIWGIEGHRLASGWLKDNQKVVEWKLRYVKSPVTILVATAIRARVNWSIVEWWRCMGCRPW